jgi:hypothetical protein
VSDHNECPCCHQDWVADTDRNCPTCELPVSEHVSVEVLCRRVREAQNRESALIVERDKITELYIEIDEILNRNAFLQDELHREREQYRLSSVCRELRSENERLKRITTWPHDANPFTSPDHDNDSNIYS